MSKLTCDIVHLQDRVYRSEDVEMVVVPGQLGETGIMENHVPLVSKLRSGAVRVHLNDGTVKTIATQGGYATCSGTRVYVLADRACLAEDIDENELREEEASLNQRIAAEEEGIKKKVLERKLRWVNIRRKVKEQAGNAAHI
ncbi:MAG: ATP synthase F1 subunit epsilon [Coriobacteriaceae bacterium]|jgi:F-type H+-transporting ATPase subunit epsilon|nr:ATP synthase F1 subunit epsilon [Coriobacteriaceae bacterium]